MNRKKKINSWRRNFTQSLTRNLGKSNFNQKLGAEKPEIKRILISRPNHRLGNLLLITPLVQEVETLFPNSKIDLFVKGGLAPIIYQNYENVDRIISLPGKPFKDLTKYLKTWASLKKYQYDLVINIDPNSSSGRLSTQFINAKYKFFGDTPEDFPNQKEDQLHFAKRPIYNFRNFLASLGFPKNDNAIPPLNLKLSAAELAAGKNILAGLVINDKKTICLFTFATGEKRHSVSWWEKTYANLQERYSNYNFIEILPKENVSQLSFKIPSFYSKDIREIGAVMANTSLFIGADSGMMHLASASKVPTLGLFSVTKTEKYTPYGKKSLAVITTEISDEEFLKTVDSLLI